MRKWPENFKVSVFTTDILFKYILAGPRICQFVGYKKGHILACHKEMSFVSSKRTFSDSKNASTSSFKCLEKSQ